MAMAWAIYQCTSCMDIVCFEGLFNPYGDVKQARVYINQHRPEAKLALPKPSDRFDEWPERARHYMQQAIESTASPDGAVMLVGSAVDAMLKAFDYKEGSVYSRIEKAVKAHLLTPEMGEWAHAVRHFSNAPRHADDEDPHATREEAQTAIDFAKALGQFLFVLPARIREGKEAATHISAT